MRLAELDEKLHTPGASMPQKRWLDQLRELFVAAGPSERSPAYGPGVGLAFESVAILTAQQTRCLWFDATAGADDPWSREIDGELRRARCMSVRLPTQGQLLEDPLQSKLEALIGEIPSELPILVTMRSSMKVAEASVRQLLTGPLKPILRRAGHELGERLPVPVVTVFDHDVTEERFWLDHGIENLRYYPTAAPTLARRLVESVFAAHGISAASTVPPHFRPRLLAGNHLTDAAAAVGFAALEEFSRYLHTRLNPPTAVVGVNRGGYLLAQMLWEQRPIRAGVLIQCECDPRTARFKLQQRIPANVGSFILIDDVVRTGRTMDIVRTELRRQYPQAFLSLLALTAVSEKYQGGPLPYGVDFCAWISRERRLRLPWSDGKDDQPNPRTYIDATGVNQVGSWLRGPVEKEDLDWPLEPTI